MTVTNEKITFDSCRVDKHAECSSVFSIPLQDGGDYTAYCDCDCHKTTKDNVTDELHALYEVDFVSVTNLAKMDELAQEAADLFGFDPNFFLAAVYVAEKALTPDKQNTFPAWKAYEEAKDQILQGSDDCITLCTGTIEEGLCKVCKGIPGVVFTDTTSELELHILKDLPEEDDSEAPEQLSFNEPSVGPVLTDEKVKTWTERLDDAETMMGTA